MKKSLITMLGFAMLTTSTAFAGETYQDAVVYQELNALLTESRIAGGFTLQGWTGQAAVIRCASPEGTGNPQDKYSCELVEIGGSKQKPVVGSARSALLRVLLANSKVKSSSGNRGWLEESAVLRCQSPKGTGNEQDVKNCELDSIEQ